FLAAPFLPLVMAWAGGRAFWGPPPAPTTVHGLPAMFATPVYMGFPLFLTAYGPGGTMPAIVASLCNLIVIGTVIAAMDVVSSESATFGKILRDTLGSFARNPLLMAALGGIAFSFAGFSIPQPVENYLDLLGAAAGPTALFAMGLSLFGQPLRADMQEVGWLVITKLLIHPALVGLLAVHVFALDTDAMKAAVFLAALPSGALVYVVAQRFDILVARTSAAIVVSTGISVVTVSTLLVWLFNG
nr:AEC family transporter [Alphaproteobacteria bacterium]